MPPSLEVTTLPIAPISTSVCGMAPALPPPLTIKQRRGLLDGLRYLLQAGDGRTLGSRGRGIKCFPPTEGARSKQPPSGSCYRPGTHSPVGHIAANRCSARTKPETTWRGWNSALRSHPFPGKEDRPWMPTPLPLPCQHHPIAWARHNPLLGEKERKGRGKKEEKKEEVIKQPSHLLLAPASVTVNPRGHFEWSLPAAGG